MGTLLGISECGGNLLIQEKEIDTCIFEIYMFLMAFTKTVRQY